MEIMESNIMSFLDIYPEKIEKADIMCMQTLEMMGVSDEEIDELYDDIYDMVYCTSMNQGTTITDNIIFWMFEKVSNFIEEKYPDLEVDYHVDTFEPEIIVNGEDSAKFFKEFFEKYDKRHIDKEEE